MSARDREVLAFCNRIRSALGARPRKVLLKGKRQDPCMCPIAATVGRGVAATPKELWRIGPNGRYFPLCSNPNAVYRWAHDFDNGKLPRWELA